MVTIELRPPASRECRPHDMSSDFSGGSESTGRLFRPSLPKVSRATVISPRRIWKTLPSSGSIGQGLGSPNESGSSPDSYDRGVARFDTLTPANRDATTGQCRSEPKRRAICYYLQQVRGTRWLG